METRAFEILIIVCMAVMFGIALYTDLRFGKIYNKLTVPCILAGIIMNSLSSSMTGLVSSLFGASLVLVLLLFMPLSGIGGGDVKLMIAVGALMGFQFVIWAMLYSAVVGGVLALAVMLRHKILLATTRNMATNIYLSVALGKPVELSSGSKKIRFPYSPAIAAGTLLTFILRHAH